MRSYWLVIVLLFCSVVLTAQQPIHIIPRPNQMILGKGEFAIEASTVISYDNEVTRRMAELLQSYLESQYGISLQVTQQKRSGTAIRFVSAVQPHAEGYRLTVDPKGVEVKGVEAGLFYGYQSLVQLLPMKGKALRLPSVAIVDAPRFVYRGLHLDVGRHFFPLDFIKKYIDVLSAYKLNVFHWHLTEDQGWRLEIKKYPKLTEKGAFRKETRLGLNKVDPDFDHTPYGGYYTQEEAREIVAYARERFVTVIPEIEMPGHALAALHAYPELGCTGGPYETATNWGVSDHLFCPGKDHTFAFLQDVLDEVMAIFPSTYIHIGGDECRKTEWKKCAHCQKRIQAQGLKDENELQSYFIRRIEAYLNSKGRSIIGWDEILEGGLAPNATVMSWRGDAGAIAAARQGHDVIMAANSYGLYLDYRQGPDTNREPLSIGWYAPLSKTYMSDPIPAKLEADRRKHIKGVQGSMWTEYIETPKKVEFMLFPRLYAVSEVAWTLPEHKSWKAFTEGRLAHALGKLDQTDTRYRVPEVLGLKDTVIYAQEWVVRNLKPSVEGGKIYYTLDGYDPSDLDLEYTGPVTIKVPAGRQRVFKAVVVAPSGRTSNYVQALVVNTQK